MIRRKCPPVVFATRSGGITIDQDACGGNPFATALIEVTTVERISLREFPVRLRALTVARSEGHQVHQVHQVPECTNWPARQNWSFQLPPGSRQESRCALLLVVSDYSGAGIAPLVGAACNERRLSAMFAGNGFSIVQGIAPCRAALVDALASFGRQALKHDVAVVYCTGHGIELNGRAYLLPGEYRLDRGCSQAQLRTQAVAVDRIARACRASSLNFVFFAGCRVLASQASANKAVNRRRRSFFGSRR